jgi:flavin reductase (DIM6/NTAB) family NADH-FMN oxidoreductase RutF
MAVDDESFKRALASWPSGVSVVTSRDGEQVHGMTVSAFSSVSLNPPLVLICAEKSSNTRAMIEAARVFTVNVLAAGQEELSIRFASQKLEARRFEGLECQDGATGCPRIPGAVSYLDCRVVDSLDAGDHSVYIGRVEGARFMNGPPLVYLRGQYRGLR